MPPDDTSNITDRILDHLGLIVSAATVAFIGVRILGLAWFDTSTALAVIQFGGAVSVTIGATVSLFSPTVSGIALGCALAILIRPRRSKEGKRVIYLVWAPTTLLALAIAPWPLAALAVIVGGVAAVLDVRSRRRPGRSSQGSSGDRSSRSDTLRHLGAYVVTIGVAGWLLAVSMLPWLPREKIDSRGEPALAAFVLSENDATLVVLRSKDRSIDRIEKSSVVKREVCSASVTWDASLMRVFFPPKYARCPSR